MNFNRRTIYFLNNLRELRYGKKGKKPKQTIKELSELIGVSKETISRRLKDLKGRQEYKVNIKTTMEDITTPVEETEETEETEE